MRALIFLFLVLCFGCSNQEPSQTLSFSGTLELTEHSVGSKVSGRLTSVLVDDGDNVSQGQLIAVLDRFDQTRRDYQRLQTLVKEGGAPQQTVEHAQLEMQDQQIVSPVAGPVLIKVREAGEVVAAGNPVFVIGDRSKVWVKIYIPENLITRVSSDQKVSIYFDGLKKAFDGHISYISPQAEFTPRNVQTPEERATQTFAVKVVVDNPVENLRPGVAADVILKIK